MRRILKYGLQGAPTWVPAGARVLHVDVQHGYAFVWVEADPSEPLTKELTPYGTGAEVPAGERHVGTFLIDGGRLVFHVYEKEES